MWQKLKWSISWWLKHQLFSFTLCLCHNQIISNPSPSLHSQTSLLKLKWPQPSKCWVHDMELGWTGYWIFWPGCNLHKEFAKSLFQGVDKRWLPTIPWTSWTLHFHVAYINTYKLTWHHLFPCSLADPFHRYLFSRFQVLLRHKNLLSVQQSTDCIFWFWSTSGIAGIAYWCFHHHGYQPTPWGAPTEGSFSCGD